MVKHQFTSTDRRANVKKQIPISLHSAVSPLPHSYVKVTHLARIYIQPTHAGVQSLDRSARVVWSDQSSDIAVRTAARQKKQFMSGDLHRWSMFNVKGAGTSQQEICDMLGARQRLESPTDGRGTSMAHVN